MARRSGRDGPPPAPPTGSDAVGASGSTTDLAGLVGWLIDRVIWAWRHSLRLIRPLAVLLLLAGAVATLAWTSIVLTESEAGPLKSAAGVLVVGVVLFVPGVIMALLWRRGVDAMAAGERLKGDVRTLIQAPEGVDEQAALDRLWREVQGHGTWRGSRIAAKGLSKLLWEHRGSIWNGKEAAELVRPPGPITLFGGLVGGLALLLVTPVFVVAAVGFAVT